jgi:hypothetical protein
MRVDSFTDREAHVAERVEHLLRELHRVRELNRRIMAEVALLMDDPAPTTIQKSLPRLTLVQLSDANSLGRRSSRAALMHKRKTTKWQ